MAKQRFRITKGLHYQWQDSPDGPGRVTGRKKERGGKTLYQKCYSAVGPRKVRNDEGHWETRIMASEGYTVEDQYIESDVDLARKFGEKFQKVVQAYEPISDGLDRMNIGQLKELAEAEEIELPNNANKETIIKTIRESQSVASV